jgi:hypothetical protein
MSELVGSRMTKAWAAALLALVTMTPSMKVGETYSSHQRLAGPAYHAVTPGFAAKVEPDPTDGNSIIIECVALGDRLITGGDGAELGSNWRPAGIPRYPLGPSSCWPQDQR